METTLTSEQKKTNAWNKIQKLKAEYNKHKNEILAKMDKYKERIQAVVNIAKEIQESRILFENSESLPKTSNMGFTYRGADMRVDGLYLSRTYLPNICINCNGDIINDFKMLAELDYAVDEFIKEFDIFDEEFYKWVDSL